MEKQLRGIAFWQEVRALPSEQAIGLVESALAARLESGSLDDYLERRFAGRTPDVAEAHAASSAVFAHGYPARDPFISRCLRFLAAHDQNRALRWLDKLTPYVPDELEAYGAARVVVGIGLMEYSVDAAWNAERIHSAVLAKLRKQIEAEAWHVHRVRELESLDDSALYQAETAREQLDPSDPKCLAEERALVAVYQKRYGALQALRSAWLWWADFEPADKRQPSNREYLPELAIEAAQEDALTVLAVVKAHQFLHGWLYMDNWVVPLAERLTPELLPFVADLLDSFDYRSSTHVYTILVQAAQQFLPPDCRYPLYEVTFRQIGKPREVFMGGLKNLYPTWEGPLAQIVRDLPNLPDEPQEKLQMQILQVVTLMCGDAHDMSRKLACYLQISEASATLKTLACDLYLIALVTSAYTVENDSE